MAEEKKAAGPGGESLKPEEIRSPREQVSEREALEPIRVLLRFLHTHIKANKDKATITFNRSKLQSVIPTRTSLRNLTNLLSKGSNRLTDDDDSNRCNNDWDPEFNDSDPDDPYIADCQAD